MSTEKKTPWNPSRRATARVKDPWPMQTQCDCCSSTNVDVVSNAVVYGKEYGKWPYMVLCQDCYAYVGLHPFTNIPLGTMANKNLRNLRTKSKNLFIKFQKENEYSRTDAYEYLADLMGIETKHCHFAQFNEEQCEEVIDILRD